MSKKTKIGLLSVTAVILAVLLFVVACAQNGSHRVADELRFDAAKLADTSVWTKVNPEPYYISTAASTDCAIMTPNNEQARKRNPHAATYITVYVNNIARGSIFARDVTQFPEGSIIVKAKTGNDYERRKPLLYTIMRKREQGYNPKVGDWEFSVFGPNGRDLQALGKLEKCQACHISEPDSDFVFRDYVKFE